MKENFSIPAQFFSVVLLVITATVSYASFSGEGTPYLFPRLLSIILIVTTIVDLVANFLSLFLLFEITNNTINNR